MATSVGSRPEQLLRGVDRFVAALADAIPQAPALPRRAARVPSRWLIERGASRIEAAVNVQGGFPGALRSMSCLDDTRLIVTARYLVVGEGSAHGFAIPMRDVLEVSQVRPDHRSNPGLMVWYRDSDRVGSFFLAFRGMTRGISGLTRAGQLMQILIGQGVECVESRDVGRIASPSLTWQDALPYADERIVWTGEAIAAVGGWMGTRHDECRMWLTEQSLLWAGTHQSGVNRLALSTIMEARDGVADRVSVGIPDSLGHRFDLSFDLAVDHVELERSANPRVRFMDALASLGVPVGVASTPLAPWRPGGLVRPTDRGRF
jgi:hypothetical protein